MKKISVSQRFIALTVVGYLTAVGAATIAVWLGTGPVLTDWQNQTIRERAEAKAQSARIVLTKLALNTQPLARNRDVVKVTIGDVSDLDRARDQVLGFNAYDEIVDVFVFDFSGEVIFRESLDNTLRASFVAEDHVMIAKEVLFDTTGEFRFSFRPGHDPGYHHFLVAQPIRYGGLVEGVLVAEVALPVSDIITLSASIGTTRLATELQSRFYVEEASGTVSVPVEGSDFYVVLQPDHELVAAAGEKLVDRVLLAVGVFLLAPFVLLSVVGLRSIVAPHKALEASQAALRENQKKLSELADIAQRSNDAIISTDLAGRTTWVNAAFVKITGYTAEEVVGRAPGEVLQGPDTDPEERARIGAALAKCEPIRSEILNYNKDGTPYWNAISIAPQIDENGKPYGFVAISSDVTEQREASEKILAAKALIEHQANHDPLTGLPNRRALDTELDRLKSVDENRVLVRIDLDHFKNVNDTLGHAAGDHVLSIVSDLLVSHIRQGDLAARVGGDEFVILMHQAAKANEAVALAERLLVEIQKEIAFEDKVCRIGASFGVASTGDGMLTNSELLLGADSALYVAKEEGRNRVVTYSRQLHDEVVASRRIAKEVERAIANGEFEPFYQPQFDAVTFEFKGVEALVRWRQPGGRILAPIDFLGVAEQLSVAGDMDAMILEKGLNTVHSLNQDGLHVPKISFNVLASRLEEPDLPNVVHELAFEGTKVCFEVLESVLVEEQSELFRSRVDLLRDIGFGVEVDDFGSGHASIIGLTKLAPDVMKIDQRLVFPIIDSLPARKMIRAIVEIGRALDIGITAEGVETAVHAKMLSEAGCDTLQGYYFAQPMSAPDLKIFLQTYDAEAQREACFGEVVSQLSA